MSVDKSNGWEAVAEQLIKNRDSNIGTSVIRQWAATFEPGAKILDLGCGTGEPVTRILVESSLTVFGIDASPTLIAEYRKRFPYLSAACEAVEDSNFFYRQFDGILAIGLMFLLNEAKQLSVIRKVSNALTDNGRFLFTSPYQVHSWKDLSTGNLSQSLGRKAYQAACAKYGLTLANEYTDEGENHYFEFQKIVESIELTELPTETSQRDFPPREK